MVHFYLSKLIQKDKFMLLAVRIQLTTSDDPVVPLVNVRLSLYDRDENDPDDYLAAGVTDARGEVLLSFESGHYTDQEDQEKWRTESLPDLYVIVYSPDGQQVLSTRAQAQIDKLPRLIQVPIPRALAQEKGLL
jgi:hypothetical protein